MRLFLSIFIMAIVPTLALAQDDTDVQEKVLNKKRSYIVSGSEQEKEEQTETNQVEASTDPTAPLECTKEDLARLDDYDTILIAYFEDSKYITENSDKFESAKEVEEFQKNAEVYTEFLGSEDYKNSFAMRERCNRPPPPLPFEWPLWMPIPNPLGDPRNR